MSIDTDETALGGMPRVAGTRIGVHHIVKAWTDHDNTIAEISDRVYPRLSEQQVREALQYAFDNRDEFDAKLEAYEQRKEQLNDCLATGPEDLDLQTT